MTTPRFLTPARLAIAGLLAVGWFLLRPAHVEPDPAIANGYRVARRLPSLRRENAARLRAFEAETLATNAKLADAKRRLARASADILPIPGTILPTPGMTATHVAVAGLDLPVMGDVTASDTLITVRYARVRLQVLADTANVVIASLASAIEMERGRASLVFASLQATIAAQDTVNAGLKADLARQSRPWYKRAAHGVEAMAVGGACGAATYVLAGPLAGVGAAVACAAIDGIRR